MAIKLNPAPTFDFTVECAIPGQSEPVKFTLVGKHMTQSALTTWADGAKDSEGKDAAFLSRVVVGWKDVLDEQGAPVPFSDETFAALIDNYTGIGLSIFTSYVKELSAARSKN